MRNVIKFPDVGTIGDELKHCSYTEGVDDSSIGIATLDKRIGISRLNDKEFILVTQNDEQVFDREQLAEFLNVASLLIDSENRYMPEIDLIGCDY